MMIVNAEECYLHHNSNKVKRGVFLMKVTENLVTSKKEGGNNGTSYFSWRPHSHISRRTVGELFHRICWCAKHHTRGRKFSWSKFFRYLSNRDFRKHGFPAPLWKGAGH